MDDQQIFTDDYGYEYIIRPDGQRQYLTEEAIDFHERRNQALEAYKELQEEDKLRRHWEPELKEVEENIDMYNRQLRNLIRIGGNDLDLQRKYTQAIDREAEINQIINGYDYAMSIRQHRGAILQNIQKLTQLDKIVNKAIDTLLPDEEEYPVYPFDSDDISTTCADYDTFANCLLCFRHLLDSRDGRVIKLDPCLHCFHAECAQIWFSNQKKICPIPSCRVRATGYFMTESFFRRPEELFPWQK